MPSLRHRVSSIACARHTVKAWLAVPYRHSTEWHRTVIVCYIKRGTVCYTRQYETQCLWLPELGERLSGSRGPMWVEKSSISG